MDTKYVVLILGLALVVIVAVYMDKYLKADRDLDKARRWVTALSIASMGLSVVGIGLQLYLARGTRRGDSPIVVNCAGNRRSRVFRRTSGFPEEEENEARP